MKTRRRRWLKPWLLQTVSKRLMLCPQYRPRAVRIPDWYAAQPPATSTLRFSIVTPSYNHGRFLEQTILSVLGQEFPHLEYIIQDGGSTDESAAILERYRRVLRHCATGKDRGQAHAINLGFQHARGDILAYLNSDDMLLPGTLHYVAAFFDNNPEVDVVYGHRVVVDEDGMEVGRWVLPPHDERILSWADFVPQETLFWRRRLWEKVGAALDESYQFAMDWELLLRFEAAGARFVRLPRFLAAFRIHPEQKSTAQLAELGLREMSRLRQRRHGRPVHAREIRHAIRGYKARHLLYHLLYDLGLLKY
jgi:glycosyltransferase involved in cell wall biosynthesis